MKYRHQSTYSVSLENIRLLGICNFHPVPFPAPKLVLSIQEFGHSLFIELLSRQSERYLPFVATDVLVCWTALIRWTVLILPHGVTDDPVLLLLWNLFALLTVPILY